MKKLSLILCILVLVPFCISLSSCNENEAEEKYITFSDSAGNVISLDERPKRVAVLFSSFAEIWTLSGGEVYATIYESVERGIVPEGTNLVDSGAGKTVNTELLISSQPDLVIASYDIPAQVKCASVLREAGIPCALMRVESFNDYLNMLNICADITGNRDAYKKYGTWEVALAAYNAGIGRVNGWLSNPEYSDDGKTLSAIPIKETREYVVKVMAAADKYRELYFDSDK